MLSRFKNIALYLTSFVLLGCIYKNVKAFSKFILCGCCNPQNVAGQTGTKGKKYSKSAKKHKKKHKKKRYHSLKNNKIVKTVKFKKIMKKEDVKKIVGKLN